MPAPNAIARFNRTPRNHRGSGAVGFVARQAAIHGPRGLAQIKRSFNHARSKLMGSKKKERNVVKKTPVGNVSDSHSGLQTTTIKVGNRKAAKLIGKQSTVGRWRYSQTIKAMCKSVAGDQGVTIVCAPLTIAKILTSTGIAYNQYQNCVALEQLNPYLATTGSTYLAPQAVPLNDRFIVKDVTVELELTNFSGVGTFVDIYVLRCKKATVTAMDPFNAWNAALAQQSGGQSVQAYPVPGNSNAGTAVGYYNCNFPHAKPNEALAFKEFWHIETVRTLEMTGNATERINFDIGVNRVIKMDVVRQYLANGNAYIPGTFCFMIVTRGAVVIDNTSGSTAALETLTYGSTKIGCIVMERYNMCGVKGNAGRLNITSGVSDVPANTLPANQVFLTETDVASTITTGTAGSST